MHPYSTTGARPATYHKRPAVTFRAALTGLDSVRHIRDFFEQREIDLGQFAPDHDLAWDVDGRSGAQSPRLMRRGADEYLVYHPNAAADESAAAVDASKAASLDLDLRQSPGSFRVDWYRALDGPSIDARHTFLSYSHDHNGTFEMGNSRIIANLRGRMLLGYHDAT